MYLAGVAQLVERKPSKLDVAGSSPVSRSWLQFEIMGAGEIGTCFYARVAQLVEHTLGKGEVIGSIPIASSYGVWSLVAGRWSLVTTTDQ